MGIEIVPYREEFLEKQVKIGRSVIDDWQYQSQSTLDRVKKVYSQPDFDPETRRYVLVDDKLVGFITSAIEKQNENGNIVARMEFPIVLQEYEEIVGDKLVNNLFKVLRDKNVRLVRVRASKYWGNTLNYVNQYDFEYEKDTLASTTFNPMEINSAIIREYAQIIKIDYNDETMMKNWGESFTQQYPVKDEEELQQWISYYKSRNRIVQLIYQKDSEGTVEGHILAYEREEDIPAISAFYAQGRDIGGKLVKLLGETILKLKENNIDEIVLSIGQPVIKYKERFEDMGLGFESLVSHYIREI